MKRILFVLLLVVLLAGCTAKEEMPVVRYVNFKVYDPVYVAIDQGFFEQHGIKVEIIGDSLGGPTAIQAVASGAAEAGLSSLMAIINANAAGLPIVGTTDIQSAIGDQPLEIYFVRADSDIHSIKDLKGKTFAVNLWNSSFHYTALMALEQNHVKEDDVNFVLLPFDQQAVALAEGQVDVIGLMEPYAAKAMATYSDFRVLFTALDVFGEKQFCTHFVNRIWARENPDEAKAFVAGIVDAIDWIENNQELAKPIIAKYTGIEAEYVPVYHFQPGGIVVDEDVQYWLDYMIRRGDVKVDWLKASDIANNNYR